VPGHNRFARDSISLSKPLPAIAAPVESKSTQPGPPRDPLWNKQVGCSLMIIKRIGLPRPAPWARKADAHSCQISGIGGRAAMTRSGSTREFEIH